MTAATEAPPKAGVYRFGPRETRGVLLGLRAGQLAFLLTGAIAVVGGLAVGPLGTLAGVVVLLVMATAALVPVAGRTAEQWLPALAAHQLSRLADGGRTYWRPRRRAPSGAPVALGLPGSLARLVMIEPKVDGGRTVGVIRDPSAGTLTAVAAVRGSTFALADAADKDRRVAAWGALLAGVARDGSPVRRLAWLECTLPDPGDAPERFWTEAGGRGSATAAASYRSLIEAASPVTQAHETHLVVQLDERRTRRSSRPMAGDPDGGTAALMRELAAVQEQLLRAGLELAGWLPPRALAAVVRTSYEPSASRTLARRTDGDGEGAGVDVAAAGPMATENAWAHYRTDDAWHVTYWISEWPRLPVGADFLAPLLLTTSCRRTVAVVAEPVDPRRAARETRAARTAELANAALRARMGQVTTERTRTEAADIEEREAELVAGHAAYRFSGYITVSGRSLQELEDGCGQVEQAAHRAFLELRRLYGQQDEAFTFTLPLARGLR
ncbi:MAG: SCO6880 family protein [Mycobacteriales bacterium]